MFSNGDSSRGIVAPRNYFASVMGTGVARTDMQTGTCVLTFRPVQRLKNDSNSLVSKPRSCSEFAAASPGQEWARDSKQLTNERQRHMLRHRLASQRWLGLNKIINVLFDAGRGWHLARA